MKYIKSKGGYYFKEYKNGKKKRISKEEFMKHKKYKNGKKKRISKKEFMKHAKSITKKPTKKVTKKQKGGQNSKFCSFYIQGLIDLWCPALVIKDSNEQEFLYTCFPGTSTTEYWKIPRESIEPNHIYEEIHHSDKLIKELSEPGSLQNPERVTKLSVWDIIKKKLEQIKKLYEYLENINLIRFFDELFECYRKTYRNNSNLNPFNDSKIFELVAQMKNSKLVKLYELLPPKILEILHKYNIWNNYIFVFLEKCCDSGQEIFKHKKNILIKYKEPIFKEETSIQDCYEWWKDLSTKGYYKDTEDSKDLNKIKRGKDFVPSCNWILIPTLERFNKILNETNFKLNLELHLLIVFINQVLRILNNYIQYKDGQITNESIDDAYDEFERYLNSLDKLLEDRHYKYCYHCIEIHNKWYEKRIKKGYGNKAFTKLRTYYKSNNVEKSKEREKRFNSNYQKSMNYFNDLCYGNNGKLFPFAFMPTTFHYGFKKFLKQYVCGISIFMTIYQDEENAVHPGIFHPVSHIVHNIGGHHGFINYNYSEGGTRYYQTLLNDYENLKNLEEYKKYLTIKKYLIEALEKNEDASKVLFYLYHEAGMNLIYKYMYFKCNINTGKETEKGSRKHLGQTLSFDNLKNEYTSKIHQGWGEEILPEIFKTYDIKTHKFKITDMRKYYITYNPLLMYIILTEFLTRGDKQHFWETLNRQFSDELTLNNDLENSLELIKNTLKQMLKPPATEELAVEPTEPAAEPTEKIISYITELPKKPIIYISKLPKKPISEPLDILERYFPNELLSFYQKVIYNNKGLDTLNLRDLNCSRSVLPNSSPNLIEISIQFIETLVEEIKDNNIESLKILFSLMFYVYKSEPYIEYFRNKQINSKYNDKLNSFKLSFIDRLKALSKNNDNIELNVSNIKNIVTTFNLHNIIPILSSFFKRFYDFCISNNYQRKKYLVFRGSGSGYRINEHINNIIFNDKSPISTSIDYVKALVSFGKGTSIDGRIYFVFIDESKFTDSLPFYISDIFSNELEVLIPPNTKMLVSPLPYQNLLHKNLTVEIKGLECILNKNRAPFKDLSFSLLRHKTFLMTNISNSDNINIQFKQNYYSQIILPTYLLHNSLKKNSTISIQLNSNRAIELIYYKSYFEYAFYYRERIKNEKLCIILINPQSQSREQFIFNYNSLTNKIRFISPSGNSYNLEVDREYDFNLIR